MTEFSLRLVAQQVQTPRGRVYRLVAYSTDHEFNSIEFNSLEDLRNTLLSAIPNFDCSELNPATTRDTQILFTTGMRLSQAQISGLGFKMAAR